MMFGQFNHKYGYAAVFAILGCVCIGAGILHLSKKATTSLDTNLELLDPSDPRAEKLLCGPKSICTALRRLGIPIQIGDLYKNMKLTEKGVSVGQIVDLARDSGRVNAQEKVLTWDQLASWNGTAILLVSNNHFVSVDPRERRKTSDTQERSLRVYDAGKPTRWMARNELAALWDGTAVILNRVKTAKKYKEPHVEWEHCLVDEGSVRGSNDAVAHGRFNFRNTGKDTLKIEVIQKSCGCTSYDMSAPEIPSGESGWIEATVKLNRRRGEFQPYLVVKTNDPDSPTAILILKSFVNSEHILSKDVAHFGRRARNSTSSLDIFIHDPGEERLRVLNTKIQIFNRGGKHSHIESSVESVAIGQYSEHVGIMGMHPVKPGDFLIRPQITTDSNCPVGPFSGEITIITNLDSPFNQIRIPLDGVIISHVYSQPRIVMLTLGTQAHMSQVVRLESNTGRKFNIETFWADSKAPISIKPVDPSISECETCYEISVLPASISPGVRSVETTAHFQLEEGTSLSVPVMIWRK